jgi:hypothetical protein
VSDSVVLQYVGFETKKTVREYTFSLRGSGGESADYVVTIANDAFLAHRVRYQDAPDIVRSGFIGNSRPKPAILPILASVSRTRN